MNRVEYQKLYRQQHRDETRAYNHRWYAQNKDKANAYRRHWYTRNKDKAKAYQQRWYAQNKDKAKIQAALWHRENRDKARSSNRRWKLENTNKIKSYNHHWYVENKNRVRLNAKKNSKRSRVLKTNGYIAGILRSRVKAALKGKSKSAHTMELVGCAIDLFRLHLQNQFRDGMQWNNHGTVWEIDHIKPCASFELEHPEQQRLCFHYSNMQPLLKEDHKQKTAEERRLATLNNKFPV